MRYVKVTALAAVLVGCGGRDSSSAASATPQHSSTAEEAVGSAAPSSPGVHPGFGLQPAHRAAGRSLIRGDVVAARRFPKRWFANASPNFRDPETPAAAWSKFAEEICGGTNLYLDMINAGVWDTSAKRIGRALKTAEETAQLLACGKLVFESLGPTVWVLRTANDESGKDGSAFHLRELVAPSLPKSPRLSPMTLDVADAAWCVGRPDVSSCELPSSRVVAKVPAAPLILSGARDKMAPVLAALASAAPARDEARVMALAKGLESFGTVEIGEASAFRWFFPQALGINHDAVTGLEKLPTRATLAATLRDADALYATADSVSPRGGELRIVLLPREPAALAKLERDLEAHLAAVVAHLKAAAGPKPTTSPEEDRYVELLRAWGLRSLEGAKLELDGSTLVVTFTRTITESERAVVAEMEDLTLRRSRRAKELIELLIAGAEVPPALFEGVAGAKFAEDVASARR